jgi:type I restriction enzyme S subunit
LRGTIVDLTDVRYLPLDPGQVERFELWENDVLISRGSGTKALVGRASLVPRIAEITIFPDTAFRLRLDPTRILPEWFVAVWNAPSTRAKFEKRVRTTAGIWKIALRDLSTVRLEVPPLDEQRAAVDIIQSAAARIDRALAKQERSSRLLDRFEQTLYLMAFEGRLVDRVPDDWDVRTLLAHNNARPVQKRTRKPKGTPMPTNQDRFRDLAVTWPKDGHSFEQLRELLPAPYDELKDIVFDEIQRGSLCQRFDEERRSIVLMRAQ